MKGRIKPRNVSMVEVICKYVTTRDVSKVFTSNKDVTIYDGRVELDTHADSFVAGRNCLVMHYTERVCNVRPYLDDYEAKTGVPIVQAATGYTTVDGKRYILIFNEALWLPNLENSLANPNQLRHFGAQVQDNPFDDHPMTICQDYDDTSFVACLKSEGTNIFIDTWTPSLRNLDEYPHVVLTSPDNWDPSKVKFLVISEGDRREIEGGDYGGVSAVNAEYSSNWQDYLNSTDAYLQPVQIFDIRAFNTRLIDSVKFPSDVYGGGPLSGDRLMEPRTFISKDRHSNTTPEDLSKVWNISVEQAKLTLDATTQHHARSATMPLSRRYCMDRMYEPKQLRTEMSTDTMDPRCNGIRGYKKCQVFGNKHMFAAAYPVETARGTDIDQALKDFIQDYGAPDCMICDGAKAQTERGSAFVARLRRIGLCQLFPIPTVQT